MLKNAKEMKELTIHSSDGEIGRIEEFYFDDEKWTIRYLIVNTGNWLSGRLVLISPVFVTQIDWEKNNIHLNLSKKQIQDSPAIDMHKPVSRQQEADYMDYYRYPYYWGGGSIWGMGLYPSDFPKTNWETTDRRAKDLSLKDTHLRSTSAVTGYGIATADGDIGEVHDFIVDQQTWSIQYLEVDTGRWLPGKKVLISPDWIDKVSWLDASVSTALSREAIRNAPEYIESKPITREYENGLYSYYGRSFCTR
jgi:sporulation protein YlmC with PRC-barrel domain